jgi:hypothetical protein
MALIAPARKEALALIDVCVLEHLIIGAGTECSFAEGERPLTALSMRPGGSTTIRHASRV